MRVIPTDAYQFAGVYSFGRGVFRGQERTGSAFSYDRLTRLRRDEFVYPKLMAWEGAFGVVPPDCDGCYVSPEFPVFEIDTNCLVPSFLNFYFKIPAVWELMSGGSTGTNVRRRRLNPSDLLLREIPLPPLAEQRRVVARIEELDGLVEAIRRLRDEEQGHMNDLLLGAFVRASAGSQRRAMRDVAPLVRRPVQVEAEKAYAELGIRSFGKGTFHKPVLSGFEIGSKRIFRIEAGDLLFSNVFAWEGAIAIARGEDAGRVGSHRFMSCVPRPGIVTPGFLRFFFLTSEGLELVRGASPGGAGRNRTLGIDGLASIEVPVPSIDAQRWFDSLEVEMSTMRRTQGDTAAVADALLPAILDRAFKGEL